MSRAEFGVIDAKGFCCVVCGYGDIFGCDEDGFVCVENAVGVYTHDVDFFGGMVSEDLVNYGSASGSVGLFECGYASGPCAIEVV